MEKIISRLLKNGDSVAVYSRDEAKHWTIKNEINSKEIDMKIDEFTGLKIEEIRKN